MSSPLDNEVHNLTQIVTKLDDFMLSTNQHNFGVADQYNLGSSDKNSWKITSSMEDHLINIHVKDLLSNTIAVDRRIEVHPSLMPIDQQHPTKLEIV